MRCPQWRQLRRRGRRSLVTAGSGRGVRRAIGPSGLDRRATPKPSYTPARFAALVFFHPLHSPAVPCAGLVLVAKAPVGHGQKEPIVAVAAPAQLRRFTE